MTDFAPNRSPSGEPAAALEEHLAQASATGTFLPLIAQVRQALADSPDQEALRLALARTLFAAGDMVAAQAEADWVTRFAMDWSRRAAAWEISIAAAPHIPDIDVLDLRGLSQRWSGHLMARRLGQEVPPPAPRARGWPLRVGYLLTESPADAAFLPPDAHDTTRITARTYWLGTSPAPGAGFIDLGGLTASAAAARMRQDDLDLLVDLSCAGTPVADMLSMLRPARIQIGFANRLLPDYDGGHDWVLGDALLFGGEDYAAGEGAQRYGMPGPAILFATPAGEGPAPPPVARNGYLTLAALPDASRIDTASTALWARMLAQMPDARFLVTGERFSDLIADRILGAFSHAGIDTHRITLAAGGTRGSALARADLVVDGLTGSSEADTLALCRSGVPVVAACGDRLSQRRSASVLTAIGHDELVVEDDRKDGQALLRTVLGLAANPERLARYRTILPSAVDRAGLADPARAVALIEEALGTIWRRATQSGPSTQNPGTQNAGNPSPNNQGHGS
ncbi:MAG: hypothetical protein RIB84_15960 [Sneathiellaceae bacterium]